MRQRIRFWLKLAVVLSLPLIFVMAVSPSPVMYDIRIGTEAFATQALGTPEQMDRLTDRVGRDMAIRDGWLEVYDRFRAFRDVVKAHRRLAEFDPQLADLALKAAENERSEHQLLAATR